MVAITGPGGCAGLGWWAAEVVLPPDLGHVLVDAVQGFEHDDGVSADHDHADADFFAARFLF